jgi:hypothetical protein
LVRTTGPPEGRDSWFGKIGWTPRGYPDLGSLVYLVRIGHAGNAFRWGCGVSGRGATPSGIPAPGSAPDGILACDLTLPRASWEGSLASSRVNLVDDQVGSCAGARFGTLTGNLAVSTRAKTPYPREAGNERFIQRWTPPSSPTRDQRDAGRLQRARCPTSLSQEHPTPVHSAASHYAGRCKTQWAWHRRGIGADRAWLRARPPASHFVEFRPPGRASASSDR